MVRAAVGWVRQYVCCGGAAALLHGWRLQCHATKVRKFIGKHNTRVRDCTAEQFECLHSALGFKLIVVLGAVCPVLPFWLQHTTNDFDSMQNHRF